jgi:uncharacterized glyoxalase superfamily protein PhnB
MGKIITEISVSNMQKSLDFYNLLGFTKDADGIIDEQGSQWSSLSLGGSDLWLIREDIAKEFDNGGKKGNGVTLYVGVDDVDAVYEQVNTGGLKMNVVKEIETMWYGLRQFSLFDPDGYLLTVNTQVASTDGESGGSPDAQGS